MSTVVIASKPAHNSSAASSSGTGTSNNSISARITTKSSQHENARQENTSLLSDSKEHFSAAGINDSSVDEDGYDALTSHTAQAAAVAGSYKPSDTSDEAPAATSSAMSGAQESTPSLPVLEDEGKQLSDHHPLPADLLTILQKVAQSGVCPWLPWDILNLNIQEDPSLSNPQHHQKREDDKRCSTFGHTQQTSLHLSESTSASTEAPRSAETQSHKKHLNGVHSHHSIKRPSLENGRKRPLVLVSATSMNSNNNFAKGSSGNCERNSGSEPDDASQYECDSETTLATSNSEISIDRRCGASRGSVSRHGTHNMTMRPSESISNTAVPSRGDFVRSLPYRSLKEVFSTSLALVLDYFYCRAGYKLSPAEKWVDTLVQNEAGPAAQTQRDGGSIAANGIVTSNQSSINPQGQNILDAETCFRKRRRRLLRILEPPLNADSRLGKGSASITSIQNALEGPPFTLQRIAEVLVAPGRYYTQTHKLCNCLEKLLLVSAPASAFGGSTGGETTQNSREEAELAALADEKGRQQLQSRQKRRREGEQSDESMSDGETMDPDRHYTDLSKCESSPEKQRSAIDDRIFEKDSPPNHRITASDSSSRELLEAAARASLRTKFDHVTVEPQSCLGASNMDSRSLGESRGRANSPPPPSLGICGGASALALPVGHGLLRHHSPGPASPTSPDGKDHSSTLVRTPSPLSFTSPNLSGDAPFTASSPRRPQLHKAPSLSGVPPFELVSVNSYFEGASAPPGTASIIGSGMLMKDLDVESRSSSDVDSESDVSFDDSASDRSDGSDCGQHNEPLTAARAMTLSRMQLQQRLQNRVLAASQRHQGDLSDSEYNNGEGGEVNRAEDAGVNDAQFSDLAE